MPVASVLDTTLYLEQQSLVVFGSKALLTMVEATASAHDREEGWDKFLICADRIEPLAGLERTTYSMDQ